MRIITGKARGVRLATLEGDATRPTSERAKEAVFSMIQFDIEGRTVLDLFGGSGQLGLEALSRGAVSCMFIDSSREAMDVVKANVLQTGFSSVSKYLVSDARNYIRKASGREVYDLVFIDPPYALECSADIIKRLAAGGMLANGAIVVSESGTEIIDPAQLPDFELIKSKQYGKKTAINIFLYRKP